MIFGFGCQDWERGSLLGPLVWHKNVLRLIHTRRSGLRFRSGLRQRRDRKFSISLQKRNRLPQTHAENAVM